MPRPYAPILVAVLFLGASSAFAEFEPRPLTPQQLPTLPSLMIQGGGADVGRDLTRASSRGTYLYGKAGFGFGRSSDVQLGGVNAADLGFREFRQDVEAPNPFDPNDTIVFPNAVVFAFGPEDVIVDFEESISPLIGVGLGADISLGGAFGNRIRPRVELEYLFSSIGLDSASAPIRQQGLLRDDQGRPVVSFDPGGQPVLVGGPIETITRGLGDAEIQTHALSVNAMLTAEVAPRVRPYLGGGIGLVYANMDVLQFEESDFTTQTQFLGGVIFSISEEWEVDVGVRYSTSTFEFSRQEIDVDVYSAAIMLNFRL